MLFSKKSFQESIKGIKAKTLVGLLTLLSTQVLVSPALYASAPTSINRQIPAGYIKANYKIKCKQAPVSTDLSSQDAAEIIAQEFYRLSKKNLTNQTIELSYRPSSDKQSSSWSATINFAANYTVDVDIDGSTGKLRHIGQRISNPLSAAQNNTDKKAGGTLSSLTSSFKKNQAANCAKAQKLIADSGYVTEAIASFKYSDSSVSVQYENNKAVSSYNSHIFNLTTTSGKEYKFYLSQDLNRLDEVWTPEFLDELHSMEDPVITKAN